MIYVLIGKTCSGKTTYLKRLKEAGLSQLVTCTTRPMREGERYGVDYFFMDNEKFGKLYSEGNMMAVDIFESAFKTLWCYGIAKPTLEDLFVQKRDVVTILTPKGYKDLIEKVGKQNVTSIYFGVNPVAQALRGFDRGDNKHELGRRILSDNVDFIGVREKVDHILDTSDMDREEIMDKLLSITGLSNMVEL